MEGIFIRRKSLLAVVISGICALLAARFGEWFVQAVSRPILAMLPIRNFRMLIRWDAGF